MEVEAEVEDDDGDFVPVRPPRRRCPPSPPLVSDRMLEDGWVRGLVAWPDGCARRPTTCRLVAVSFCLLLGGQWWSTGGTLIVVDPLIQRPA